jgi:hypothetical protein
MENLILATRLLVLKSNLDQGANLLDSLQRRGKELEYLNRVLGRAYGTPASAAHLEPAADNIEEIIQKYEGSLQKYQGSLDPSVAADLYSAADNIQDIIQERARSLRSAKSFQVHEEQLTALRKEVNAQIDHIRLHLDAAREVVRLMQMRIVKIESDRIKGTIANAIVAKANASISCLENIQKKLEDAEKAEGVDSEKAGNLMNEAWDEYTTKLDLDSQPVLTEYVEFLGGLALRHTGLDAGVCQIADELIGTVDRIERAGSGSLTIPARYEAVTAEVARIIRLGYPEWTIWALPLVAHQFGHLVVSNSPVRELQDFIRLQSQHCTDSFMQHYFADAFAAYTLGPAYACAVLFLRLDLSAAYKDKSDQQPAAAKRAYVVFSTLDWVNRKGKEQDQPYAGITDKLKSEWDAALRQTNQTGKLEADEERQLNEYVEFLGTIALRIYPTLRPPLWKSVQEWPAKLLQNEGRDIRVDGTEEFRDVLNAAWVCRISNRRQSVEIEKAASGLWKRINETRRGGGSPPWTS